MKRLLALLFLLTSPAWASDAVLVWSPSSTATSYTARWGTAPGTYSQSAVSIPTTLTFANGAMFQNVRNYLVVTASNASGTSGFSTEISGFPRPTITGAVAAQETGFIRLTVIGTNFSDGISTTDIELPGMTILAVTRISANEIHVDYTLDPGTPNDPVDLTVSNGWTDDAGFVASVKSEVFVVPAPGLAPPVPIIMDIH